LVYDACPKALFLAVILDTVNGILAPMIVINTIYTESVILYMPSSFVVIILARYILYINPRHLVATLNIVKVSIAFKIFLIIHL